MEAKGTLDVNFEPDARADRQERMVSGLAYVTDAMEQHGISWDIHVADALMDECMLVGDVNGRNYSLYSTDALTNSALAEY